MSFFAKIVTGFQLFLQESFIKNVRLGSKYASEKTEIFKMKLRLAKLSRLLQHAAFLVVFVKICVANIRFEFGSSHQRCSFKEAAFRKFAIFTGNACVRVSFLWKETPTQVLSCEHCEIFKNTYFEEYLRAAAFVWVVIIHLWRQHFISLLLFVRLACLYLWIKNGVIAYCHKQLCFADTEAAVCRCSSK